MHMIEIDVDENNHPHLTFETNSIVIKMTANKTGAQCSIGKWVKGEEESVNLEKGELTSFHDGLLLFHAWIAEHKTSFPNEDQLFCS